MIDIICVIALALLFGVLLGIGIARHLLARDINNLTRLHAESRHQYASLAATLRRIK